jgi:hypothetical protein
MNAAISRLFTKLSAPEEGPRVDALAQLAYFLGDVWYQDDCRRFLAPELQTITLSAKEVEEIFEKATVLLDCGEIDWRTRMSPFLTAIINAEPKFANPLLGFFSRWASTFNEQQSFSSTAGLTTFLMRASLKDRSTIILRLSEHHTMEKVETFKNHESARVRESAARAARCIQEITREVP